MIESKLNLGNILVVVAAIAFISFFLYFANMESPLDLTKYSWPKQ